ncbi:phosphotransferase enzyme family protein [Aspergillus neoniger CBS 115656]|uniref:Phosphotransferase enzyme family protein n=1 Tax=Aspergillus neoniger (strain CBS 115656) TaxID=1448310 RepID=A0A318YKF1_ASPNB|nr:phosphotransferase enzyme family protein [Aspergillus neoniger CBS 115656]PYH34307.1 phosphotransferase enzyme family protein [Aspergillus neoniger CBS 115656]
MTAPLRALKRVIKSTLPRFHRMYLSTSPSTASKPPLSDQHTGDVLFSYTSGRWLWDEAAQLRKRYQPFNVEELKKAAARSVDAKHCVNLTKLPEGSYNKTLLLTMDNDVQVIAKVPNPYVSQQFVTASELGLPVPRVFAWSNKKDQPVGVDIVSQLASIQVTVASADFSHYGSLFYKDDIDGGITIPGRADKFCIGPSCDLRFWEEERRFMDAFRGPWSSSEAYAMGIARREKEWISRFANPRHSADPLRQSDSQESPDCHIELLDRYLKLVPHLIPSDPGQNRSVLWHADLHFGNIFVKDNQIVSIIDWQGCSSLPISHACRMPKFLRFQGSLLFDLPPATGLRPEEKEDNLRRYQLTQLQRLYISRFRDIDNDVFSAISFPQALTRQQLIDFSGYTWDDDGLFLFQEMMLRTWREWMGLTGQPQSSCPVAFTADELASHAAEEKSWEDFEAKVETMRNLVSSIIDSADDKDSVKEALRAWKLSDLGPASLSGNLMSI